MKEFIEYFGEEIYLQQEALGRLHKIEFKLSRYLGLDLIPVVVEDIKEDSRYYIEEDYISISSSLILNYIESLKCLIHEYRHYYQKYCITKKNVKENKDLIIKWKKDFKKNLANETICSAIEVDAYAFTKYILKSWFHIEYNHHDHKFNQLLENYIIKYL